MDIQKTTGIVLSSSNFGESDIISTILTKNYGKRKFLFKGLRKSNKRSKSATEPGTINSLMYYYHENKDFHIVNEYNTIKHYLNLRNNLGKIFHLYFLLETVEKTTGYNDTEVLLFELLGAGIDTLSKTDFFINLSAFFTLHLLKMHGLLPEFEFCKKCGNNNFNEFSLDLADLSSMCKNCNKNNKILPALTKNFILVSLKYKYSSINQSIYKSDDILDLLFHLSIFIENYFHIQIKSKEFIFSEKYF